MAHAAAQPPRFLCARTRLFASRYTRYRRPTGQHCLSSPRVFQKSPLCKHFFAKPYPLLALHRSSAPMKPSRFDTTVITNLLRGRGAIMRITLAVAVACLTIGGMAGAGEATAAIRKPTDIPAQGLGPALMLLAKEFDFQVLYRTEVVGTLRTRGASGAMTAAEALEHVLSGTCLTYKYLDEKTVTIVPA